ncbi:MAG: hypothetical protein FJ255_12985 [Phycisphaerae bacterium]|nr:hypothetical protein [Phycisphaerae bacterium]
MSRTCASPAPRSSTVTAMRGSLRKAHAARYAALVRHGRDGGCRTAVTARRRLSAPGGRAAACRARESAPRPRRAPVPRRYPAISSVSPAAWDALVPADNPFLEHRFLHGLETSGAVGRGTGWQPCHVVVEDEAAVGVAAGATHSGLAIASFAGSRTWV